MARAGTRVKKGKIGLTAGQWATVTLMRSGARVWKDPRGIYWIDSQKIDGRLRELSGLIMESLLALKLVIEKERMLDGVMVTYEADEEAINHRLPYALQHRGGDKGEYVSVHLGKGKKKARLAALREIAKGFGYVWVQDATMGNVNKLMQAIADGELRLEAVATDGRGKRRVGK